MKQFKLLFVFALLTFSAVSLTSCSDDDNTPVQQVPSLGGMWYFSKTGTGIAGNEALQDYEHQDGCTKDYVEFLDNNVYKERYHVDAQCTIQESTSAWSLANNIITVNDGDVTTVYEIVSLTTNQLKVRTEAGGFYEIRVFTKS